MPDPDPNYFDPKNYDSNDIRNEPHLSGRNFAEDESEAKAAHRLRHEAARVTDADIVEHTVWSEPSLSADLAGREGLLPQAARPSRLIQARGRNNAFNRMLKHRAIKGLEVYRAGLPVLLQG